MAEEDRATVSSIKIPTWDGTEGEKAQTHVAKLESAAELGGHAEALEMSFENALPSSAKIRNECGTKNVFCVFEMNFKQRAFQSSQCCK